jgi:hypothetical protein
MITDINWGVLSYTLASYQAMGYRYVEVPWIVPNGISMLTCPSEKLLMKIEGTNTSLVGSAEQSLIKLDLDGDLEHGKYVACSPCFRVEDATDGWHFPTFMKVELYRNDRTDAQALYDMITDAEHVMKVSRTDVWCSLDRRVTSDGVDLEVNGIEVGSYGIRNLGNGFRWVFGTGIALPRFSQATA